MFKLPSPMTRTLVAALTVCVGLALQGCSEDKPFVSPTIDDDTTCAFVLRAFDQSDKPSIYRIANYVRKTLQDEDQRRGKDIIARLDRDGLNSIVAMPITYCRQGESEKLHGAVMQAYDGLIALREELIGR